MESAGRPWRVWVTRSEPGAATTAAAVRALGHLPLVAPLTAVHPLPVAPPDLDGVAALAFTSAAGVRAFAALTAGRNLPVFAVGRATAAAARAAGWTEVTDADGSAADLVAVLARAPLDGAVLAPGAREPAFDLSAALGAAGRPARAVAVYETRPVWPPPPEPLAALAVGGLDAVLVQAGSAARALGAAVAELPIARAPRVLALSAACAPGDLGWPVAIAAAPRQRDLLALLPRLDSAALAR